MSAPAQKALPSPVTTTALTSGLSSASVIARSTSRRSPEERAFICSGRASVSRATRPPASMETFRCSKKTSSFLRRQFASDALPGDYQLHDLSRSVPDLQSQHVPHALLYRPIGLVAELPVQQDAVLDDIGGHLRGPPLAHRRLRRVGHPVVLQPQCLVAQQTRGGEQRLGFGQRERDPLKLAERLVEGLAVGDVLPGLLDGDLGGTDALQPDQGPAEVEALHHL